MAAGDVRVFNANHSYRHAIVGDGTGDYVQIDAWGVAREAAGTADTVGTLSAWIFRNETTNDDCIISAGDTNAVEYINFHVHNGYLNITLADGGAPADFDIESDDLVVPAGEWVHVAVVQDGTQPILYVNGLAVDATNDISTDLTK
ncbi:MAG: LamG domain-containing protein, partial [Gammaproteobacteria bacterium]|nr:LamG domain-containing protein [Gammaproteobacteria bacterium]